MNYRTVRNNKIIGILTAVILIILGMAQANNARALPPLSVGLISFSATAQNNAALLEWETATELNTAGFTIQRKLASELDTAFTDISPFISSTGDVAAGATYSYLDETAVNNQTYSYQLTEIENSGADTILETAQVTIGVQATATPIAAGGGSGSSPATTSPVTVATSTPSATPTQTRAAATATTASQTAVSPTIVPTERSSTSGTSSTPTPRAAATSTPAAIANNTNNSNSSTVFAQGNTPAPTAYPVTITENNEVQNAAVSTAYPADSAPILSTTATAYPAALTIEETTTLDDASANDGVNVIGSNATSGDTAADDNSGDSSSGYLWVGFLLALFVFIAGLIGTAVLFVRKK